MKSIRLLLTVAVLASSLPARAIELSLEENRAERGSVGYVDMRRLFTASPDATRAREGLEELVRQAEERVNGKKSELLHLRQELSTLKIERDELARSTPTATVPVVVPPANPMLPVPSSKPMAPTPAPKPVEIPKPAPKPVEVPVTPVTATPPPAPVPAPTAQPLTINLPGLTDGPLNLERPGGSPLNPTRAKVETAPVPAPIAAPAPAPAPAAAPAPVQQVLATGKEPVPAPPVAVSTPAAPTAPPAPTGPTLAQRLLEYDGRIVAKQGEIDRLQAELDRERLGAEKTLLDAEGRKTDQVLARLYRAISEVAKREGVSVVVDKSATLYGHPAVDLTDKILKQLRGVVPAQ